MYAYLILSVFALLTTFSICAAKLKSLEKVTPRILILFIRRNGTFDLFVLID